MNCGPQEYFDPSGMICKNCSEIKSSTNREDEQQYLLHCHKPGTFKYTEPIYLFVFSFILYSMTYILYFLLVLTYAYLIFKRWLRYARNQIITFQVTTIIVSIHAGFTATVTACFGSSILLNASNFFTILSTILYMFFVFPVLIYGYLKFKRKILFTLNQIIPFQVFMVISNGVPIAFTAYIGWIIFLYVSIFVTLLALITLPISYLAEKKQR